MKKRRTSHAKRVNDNNTINHINIPALLVHQLHDSNDQLTYFPPLKRR
jgi:hypothetical protein